LWKVTEQPSAARVEFFREQADIVADVQKALEQTLGVGSSAQLSVDVRKPEATRQEDALSRR
jgi:hypothetical protein